MSFTSQLGVYNSEPGNLELGSLGWSGAFLGSGFTAQVGISKSRPGNIVAGLVLPSAAVLLDPGLEWRQSIALP